MSIPTEKRLAKELHEIFIEDARKTRILGGEGAWRRVAQHARKLMKAHGAAMFKKGQIS